MTDQEKQELVKSFLAKEMVGVLSTVSAADMQPEAALVAITATDELALIFGTSTATSKYKNLQQTPNVAVVVGTSFEEKISVQYKGVARELTSDAAAPYQTMHIQKHPTSRKFVFAPDERMFVVSPILIRYSDYKSEPKVIFELTEFAKK